MIYFAEEEKDLATVSQQFLQAITHQRIFAIKGEMGVGKTTFISYLANEMGVKDTVKSPTFGYVNEYESSSYGRIFHLDLYRIEDEYEAYDIGIEEYISGEDWVFIEWAENIENLLDDNCVWIKMTKNKNDRRTIEVEL